MLLYMVIPPNTITKFNIEYLYMSELEEIIYFIQNKNPSIDEKQQAISYLGEMGDRSAIPFLRDLLIEESNIHTKGVVALSLGKLNDNKSVNTIMKIIRDHRFINNRAIFIHALSKLNCWKYYLYFVEVYCNGDLESKIRADAILTGQIGKISIATMEKSLEILKRKRNEVKGKTEMHSDEYLIMFLGNLKYLISYIQRNKKRSWPSLK